jgi:hypothetical protein
VRRVSGNRTNPNRTNPTGRTSTITKNVFVLGLDDANLRTLRSMADADRYRFHRLLTFEELQAEEIDIAGLVDAARRELDAFDGPVDAIVGYWDFPVSTMVPILAEQYAVPANTLQAVLKCEHKYWSRLEQQKVIDEYPNFGLVRLEDEKPPENVAYPLWLKPVKAFSSALAYKVDSDEGFASAMAEIRKGIERFGDPFNEVLRRVELPAEIASAGGNACVAEEAATGVQLTVEGYTTDDELHVYGVVESVNYPGTSSFLRYQYPARLPEDVTERLTDIAKRIVRGVGLSCTAFNIEFFWDEETGTIRVLEVNPRHSQSHAMMFEQVDGVPNHQCVIRLATGIPPDLPNRQGPYQVAAKWYLRRFSDGVVRHAPTEEEIADIEKKLPGVTVELVAGDGDRLSELPEQDSYSYHIATIHVGANDQSELERRYQECADALPFDIDEA